MSKKIFWLITGAFVHNQPLLAAMVMCYLVNSWKQRCLNVLDRCHLMVSKYIRFVIVKKNSINDTYMLFYNVDTSLLFALHPAPKYAIRLLCFHGGKSILKSFFFTVLL